MGQGSGCCFNGGEGEDLEPLFDYHRVQLANFVCLDEVVPLPKRAKISQKVEKADDDVKVIEVVGDDDWLPPPPKVIFDKSKESGKDSTIKALRCTIIRIMGLTSTLVIIKKRLS